MVLTSCCWFHAIRRRSDARRLLPESVRMLTSGRLGLRALCSRTVSPGRLRISLMRTIVTLGSSGSSTPLRGEVELPSSCNVAQLTEATGQDEGGVLMQPEVVGIRGGSGC